MHITDEDERLARVLRSSGMTWRAIAETLGCSRAGIRRRALGLAHGPRPQPEPCGTYAAYTRHHRRGETPCADCRRAKAAYQRGSTTDQIRAERS